MTNILTTISYGWGKVRGIINNNKIMTKQIEVSEETYEKIKEQLGEDEQIKEINNLDDLIGEIYCFQCARYIYHGKIEAVNSDFITLKKASVIFNTGDYSNPEAEDKQEIKKGIKIMRQSVESFYQLKW